MAITNLDGLLAGFKRPVFFRYGFTGTNVAGRPISLVYLDGYPGKMVAPTPGVSGAALTSYAGQLPFENPTAGQTAYLARFVATSTVPGDVMLCDRLWHNSGVSVSIGLGKTVNSVAWPARDNNGSTNGEGVMIGVEFTTAPTAGTTSEWSISYTNSDGTAGRTGYVEYSIPTTGGLNMFLPFTLQGTDKGVRSVQTISMPAGLTSAVISLVAYRVLAVIRANDDGGYIDFTNSGMPIMYENTVPFIIMRPATTTSSRTSGMYVATHG